MTAHDILNNPFLNKGTAFTLEERKELGLSWIIGHLTFKPSRNKRQQTYAQMQTKVNDLENVCS